MCTALYHGTEAEWTHVFNAMKATTDATLRNDLLSGLACARDPLLQQSLVNDQLANSNNILTPLVNVANRPSGWLISWNFLKANWDEIYSKFVVHPENTELDSLK